MNSGISVIIPSFNGLDLLRENLPFVQDALLGIRPSEIIVVDDHSTDGTTDHLNDLFPGIRILRNTRNMGYAYSINRGLKEASCGLVLLLNNDVKPQKNYIKSALHYFDSPETFGVMGVIREKVSDRMLEGIKYPVLKFWGFSYRDVIGPEVNKPAGFVKTFYICGGNAIIDREKMLLLKGFSEIYAPFYLEDVDLSVRAWLSGWKLYFNTEAVCYHQHSATIKKYYDPDFIKQTAKRNRLIINYLYLNGIHLSLFLGVTFLKAVFYALLYPVGQRSAFPAYRDFFRRRRDLNKHKSKLPDAGGLYPLLRKIQSNIRTFLNQGIDQ